MKVFRGSAAITTVLTFMSVFTLIGVGILLYTTDISRTSGAYYRKVQAENNIHSCLDDTLYKINRDFNFTGQLQTVFESNVYCDINVTNQTEQIKIVEIKSIYEDYQSHKNFRVNYNQEPILVESYPL